MVLLNLFDGSLIEGLVDIIITAIWLIPLWFVAKFLFAYLTAANPKDKQIALGALITSFIFFVVFVIVAILFNTLVKPELFS
jgi:hypothetical protein